MPQSLRPERRMQAFIFIWLILTAISVCFDFEVNKYFKNHHALMPFLTYCDYMGGYSIHCLTFTIIVAMSTRWKTVVEYLAAMWLPVLTCSLLKIIVGRYRPDEHLGFLSFAPFSVHIRNADSFPSGQATSAMALATLLGIYFPKGKWVFWTLGAWAALGRVARTRHFLSDTVFGSGLGIVCVFLVFALIARWENHRKGSLEQ